MKVNRREFLKSSSLASTALLVPKFLQAFHSRISHENGKVLVVIQLSGGNDGLNTIVPYQDDLYYQSRPGLGLKENDLLKMTDTVAFHKNLYGFASLFDEGEVSILNSVGYPNPNRSHFRSMDIWQSASDPSEHLPTGWIGRFLDHHCQDLPYPPAQALEISDALSLAMKGAQVKGLALKDPRMLYRTTQHPYFQALSHEQEHHHATAGYLYKTLAETTSSAEYLFETSKTYRSSVDYPSHSFGKQLKQVAQLINAGVSTQVYYVSLAGFDTHAGQKWQQARLLKQYSEALKAFTDDLKTADRFKDTLIMTFSEFGRRVKQNASNGTDHGAANTLFLVGGRLKQPGIYNALPDLSDLDNGDLKYAIDFRQVYTTIIEKWLGYKAQSILGGNFTPLNVV